MGKGAAVTGAASGIGKAIATAFIDADAATGGWEDVPGPRAADDGRPSQTTLTACRAISQPTNSSG
jgi:NAD(P)-dependent dehydrogenase (short-subunit alcohol dehydrogenase family)